jgi:opacity protein-like surface antigen
MRIKRFLLAAMLMVAMTAQAQWRVGVTAGADYNVHSMNLQYMNDFLLEGRWGATLGVTGQYDFTDWLGVRADLNWVQKNYRLRRDKVSETDYKYRNNYLQLPVMASFSFGSEKWRGFCNLGVYAGYWLNSSRKGTDVNTFSQRLYEFSEKVELDSDRDQRWDCGLVGGVGLEYRLFKHWAIQGEVRYYYSTTSTRKQYMRVKDYRYNSTSAIQIGANYIF